MTINPNVQDLCGRLVANNLALTFLVIIAFTFLVINREEILGHTSIRELVLKRKEAIELEGGNPRVQMPLSPETVRDLPLMIARNQNLQNLELRRLNLNSDTVRSIAQRSTGH
jgi:hypothetical protein